MRKVFKKQKKRKKNIKKQRSDRIKKKYYL